MGNKGSKRNSKGAKGKDDAADAPDDPVIFSSKGDKVTIDDFDLIAVVGKGSFGKVLQVRQKETQQVFAMKVLRKDRIIARNQVDHTMAERDILMRIQHPFIVSLNYAFQTEDKLYMILNYINGGELFFHLKKENRFAVSRVRLYTAEILLAIAHLHSLEIVYRDLKPENILLDNDGHIIITDFGLSKALEEEATTHTFCGTPEYLAPEILDGKGHGKAVDWWSLGTLTYEMLTGLPPFYSRNVNVMYQKILNGTLKFPATLQSQDDAKSLLEGLLRRTVSERLGSGPTDASEIKAHPFFRELDWERVLCKEYTPEFKPPVQSVDDISQIDTCFTQEPPKDTPVENTLSTSTQEKNLFDNFTYVADSEIAAAD